MSGGTSSGGRGRWLIVVLGLAVCGAAAGAWAGRRIAPDEPAVAMTLAVAGFGLGGLVGMLGLALRALLLGAIGLLSRSRDPAAAPSPAAQDTEPDAPASPPAPDPELQLTADPQPQPGGPGPPAAAEPGPQPEPGPEPDPPPAPPAGEAPGWYPDPRQPGRNRYWDGRTWTAHVSRDREPHARRGSRSRRSSR
ncbi:DUF2510 domain-containing protein [Solirubrobacter soli]|uniref:DUF2510 domain-containing protein n=1 Tax=Solirubrobacter soli TaxID=363832 RepID=UPI0003FDD8FA|nr:DUF2510 domain-containing protein [Solirubrobacter soli]